MYLSVYLSILSYQGITTPGDPGYKGVKRRTAKKTIGRDLKNETRDWMLQLLFLCPRTNPSDKPAFAKKQNQALNNCFFRIPLVE
jgi:hypothetical protein